MSGHDEPEATTMPQAEAGPKPEDPAPKMRSFTYEDAVIGTEIHNSFGHRVFEHRTAGGHLLAVKVNTLDAIHPTEADMTNLAAAHGVLAPRARGVYDIYSRTHPIARVMISDRVPGVPLVDVWRDLPKTDQSSVKDQLREQVRLMRTCTQAYIGRPDRQPARNIYDGCFDTYCGPFRDEESFERWCMTRLPFSLVDSLSRWKWKRMFRKRREALNGGSRFVLTHGDLSPRNIMVQGNVVTGIVDWEHSGFYPDYVEYAFALGLGPGIEKWWKPVLKDILEPCSKDFVKFTSLVEQHPGRIPSDDYGYGPATP